jgi:hypothetical protein
MNRVIRSLFRRENVLVVLLVIGAFLGVIGVPQKIGITADQILLALLAVLALDTLIERLGYLDRIENLLKENQVLLGQTEELVRREIEGKIRPSDFLSTDRAIDEEFFASASRVILTGITLQSRIRQLTHILEQRLRAGAAIQLALLEPSDSNLHQMVARGWGDASPEYYRNTINGSVARLDIIARNAQGKGQMEIGYLCHLSGYTGPCVFAQTGPPVFTQTGPPVFAQSGPLVFAQTGP